MKSFLKQILWVYMACTILMPPNGIYGMGMDDQIEICWADWDLEEEGPEKESDEDPECQPIYNRLSPDFNHGLLVSHSTSWMSDFGHFPGEIPSPPPKAC